MSDHPSKGVTLGRLIAAERNALAAVGDQKKVRERLTAAEQKIERLEKQLVEYQQLMNAFNARLAALQGSGPTQKG